MDCMATARPPVLAATAARNRTPGAIRRRPETCAARCSAAAQTASSAPERLRMIHGMTVPLASLVACRVLHRRPEAGVGALASKVARHDGGLPPLVRNLTTSPGAYVAGSWGSMDTTA